MFAKKYEYSSDLGVLEARFEQTTQSEHDEIQWSSQEETMEDFEMHDQK